MLVLVLVLAQLCVGVVLSVGFLVLQAVLRPYREGWCAEHPPPFQYKRVLEYVSRYWMR